MKKEDIPEIKENTSFQKKVWITLSIILTGISLYLFLTDYNANGVITSRMGSSSNISINWAGVLFIAVVLWTITFFLFRKNDNKKQPDK